VRATANSTRTNQNAPIVTPDRRPEHDVPGNRRMLNVRQAATYCGVSKSFLDKARCAGDGPDFHKLGHRVTYHVDDLDAWLAEHKRRHTSQ
jgi:predicted DNA-binding transcriptional regulator AlpA